MVIIMLGFNNQILTIEQCTGADLRGIPTYSEPITKHGFLIEKTTYNYQTNIPSSYFFITLHEPGLVKKEDKINGHRVETVKEVYLHGRFVVCEVTAI